MENRELLIEACNEGVDSYTSHSKLIEVELINTFTPYVVEGEETFCTLERKKEEEERYNRTYPFKRTYESNIEKWKKKNNTDEEEFYDDNYDDFESYEDAESFYKEYIEE